MRLSPYRFTGRFPIAAAAAWLLAGLVWSQQAPPTQPARGGAAQPAPAPEIPPPNQTTDPLLRAFTFRSIGPATMMGRVDDIAGSEKDPMIIYVGFATGGLWKSADGGNHWTSQFDNNPIESIGAVAVAPSNPDVVYVGTGESNNRQSSSIGDGVWGTTDGGRNWTHLGLADTQSIARIVVDPTNPNVVYVAALGHLFGPNAERGLYKTTDGGKTWKKSKYIDADTGFTDLAIDPTNPKILYAASYQRRRTWWGFNGGGPGSALWKTIDGGESWTKLDGQGWPKPKDGVYGRIALSVHRANPKIVYALVEAGASGGTGGGTADEGGPARGGRGGAGGGTESAAGAPLGAAAAATGPAGAAAAEPAQAGGRGRAGAPPPPPDPNKSGIFRSEDGGKTWTLMSNQVPSSTWRPMYFSQIRVDPVNDQKILTGGNPGQISTDGGKTWRPIQGSHTDYHALWINPKDPRVVWVGHDGGIDSSNDGGETWDYHNDIAVGQFYQVSADMRRPYYVCGGLQDNNAWCGPSALRSTTGPSNLDWYTVAGGDGFYTRQDPTDWAVVYAESQDGNMVRHDLRAGTQKSIRPTAPAGGGRGGAQANVVNAPQNQTPPAGQPNPQTAGGGAFGGGFGGRGGTPNIVNAPSNLEQLRFYWNAPFEISPHDSSVVYTAAQYFFKSTNRGDTWWMNTTDLTKNINRWAPELAIMGIAGDKPMASKHDGFSSSSLATQVRESPSRPGVIWIGTDDGNLEVSQDGGRSFANVYNNIDGAPKGYVLVVRIEPSHFDPGTAYVALDNHRNDDWRPYLFKTTDFGKTWENIAGNLPAHGHINAFREDPENSRLLFTGTEFGLYVSLEGGKEWKKFMQGMPNVRVDDILIHTRDHDLIVGTHGRSIYIADDITPLEHYRAGSERDLTLFDPRPAIQWKNDPQSQRHVTNRDFHAQNPQGGTAIHILSKTDMGKGKVEFLQNNNVVASMEVDIKAGLNRVQWNMRGLPPANQTGRGNRGGAAPAAAAGQGSTGGENAPAGQQPQAPVAPTPTPSTGVPVGGGATGGRAGAPSGVPFVATGGRGGGGGGGGGGRGGFGFAPVGPLLDPGVYMIRLTVGSETLHSSVTILEDTWMRAQ